MASSRGALAALLLLACAAAAAAFLPAAAVAAGTPDGSEEWGYVEVRPSKRCKLDCCFSSNLPAAARFDW